MREQPHWRTTDGHGIIMPWYTRPCLKWLNGYVEPAMSVFEYGVGQSSQWYRSRGCYTYGVDTKADWITDFDLQILETDENDYIGSIYSINQKFDIVVIDGDYRDRCTQHAIECLKPGGYLIIDNWEQASADLTEWPKTKELIKNLEPILYKEPLHEDWVTLVVEKPYTIAI